MRKENYAKHLASGFNVANTSLSA